MKIIPILQKLESFDILTDKKTQLHKKISKGDFVSVIYYDLEKEQVRLEQFTGLCTKIQSKGLNTKIHVHNALGQVAVDQQFFLYSKAVLDVSISRKK
jgi:ribosomal protein L19